jgi:23S rRNA (guanine745-N1)-methyltransferase
MERDIVLDAGCGDGYYLGELAARTGPRGYGIDISIPAIDAAARRYPACQWTVANADRFIPCADSSFSLVLSITARMNAPEFHRVLHEYGRLLVALPAPDDLVELRGPGRERIARTVETFAAGFELAATRRVTTCADLGWRCSALHLPPPAVAPRRSDAADPESRPAAFPNSPQHKVRL